MLRVLIKFKFRIFFVRQSCAVQVSGPKKSSRNLDMMFFHRRQNLVLIIFITSSRRYRHFWLHVHFCFPKTGHLECLKKLL